MELAIDTLGLVGQILGRSHRQTSKYRPITDNKMCKLHIYKLKLGGSLNTNFSHWLDCNNITFQYQDVVAH